MDNIKRKSRNGGCIFKLVKLCILTLVIVALLAWFALSHLGALGDYALKTVTAGTPIDAGLGGMKVDPFNQTVEMRDFYITNPPGFAEGNAAQFGEIYVATNVNPFDFLSRGVIEVNEMRVVGLMASVELKTSSGLGLLLNSPRSNLTEIADTLKKKYPQDETSATPEAAETTTAEEQKAPMKYIVRKLVFEDGSARTGLNGTVVKVPLVSFSVENLGVEEGGLTVGELTTRIMAAIANQVTVETVRAIAKQAYTSGKDAGSDAVKQGETAAKEAVKNLQKSLSELLKPNR